ncbi:MAG TPA: carboxypeptidase regulatory-like domain-containing protein [Terriglobales bacterium]|nr:carboxypeptidase regulatory-like domain-containing protein [Terriglobales bacterium]
MKKASSLAIAVSILIFVFCASIFVAGQGTDLGTIRGTVTDSSGAVVPNAQVTILDLHTGATRETQTNSQGDYQMFGLPSGSYKVTIASRGMTTQEITGIVINGSDVITANARLKVSSTSENVVVTAEEPIIDNSDQTISNTITSSAVIDLPRDSRDVYQFLYLNPNITQGVDAGEFKFLGFQSYGATFTIDGQRSNNTIFGSPTSSEPSLEAVSEVNVLSNDFSAEYSGIANIRITTKRGENQFHGSIFYNNKNSALAAWQTQDIIAKQDFQPTVFQPKFPTPYFNFNDLGASLGGPIPKLKKTWFFMAYERNYDREPVSFSSNKLPHPSLWTGDFSGMITDNTLATQPGLPAVPASFPNGGTLTPQEVAADTYCQGWPNCAGNGQQFVIIPSHLLSPYTQKLIDVYFPKISPAVAIIPKTGRIADLFQTLVPGGSTRDLGTLRIDHDLSDRDHIYGVYNAQASAGGTAPVFQPMTGLGLQQRDIRDNTLSFSYVHMFNNTLINEARGGINRENSFTESSTTLQNFLSSIGFDQSAIDAYASVVGTSQLSTHGYPFINLGSNFVTFGRNADRNTDRQTSQYLSTFGDTLTWVVHNHNFKMGADVVRNVGQDGFVAGRGNPRGSMKYTGSGVNPFANFLLGEPATSVTFIPSARPIMDAHDWEQGYFFQDDWKFNSRLTLNLGLRYELVTPWVDKHDIMLNFDPTFNNNTGRFIIPSDQTLQYLDPIIPATLPVMTAAKSGLGIGRGLVRTDKNNFAPRIGGAFRLTDNSVLRGGYGLYFPTSAAQGIRDPLATNSFNIARTKDNEGINPTQLQPWPTPLTGGDVVSEGGFFSSNSVPVGLRAPTVQQYNATYERQLGLETSVRISYLGITAHGLVGGLDLNEIAPSSTGWGTTVDNGTGIGDGVTPCSPDDGDCAPTQADLNRLAYPTLGDFALAYGNYGRSQSNSYQIQFERRYTHGLMFNASYTYASQRSTGIDGGNSSLGGVPYDPFNPELDYTQDAWISRHRFVLYGIYDLPVGRGKAFGSGLSKWSDAIIGGWQTTFQMFAKSGTAFTPYWTCDNCGNGNRFVGPGNIASESIDALGDFNDFIGYRPMVVGNYKQHVGDQLFNPAAFAPPPMGADVFSNPAIARKDMLWGPGAWGVNFGLHKDFKIGERVTASLGADFDNIFNHPIRMPNQDFGDSSFSYLGGFDVAVNPALQPVVEDTNPNPDFGRAFSTFSQEGIDSRRTTRLRLRITF